MTERPKNPDTPEAWQDEVYLTKIHERLVLLKNQSSARFIAALAAVGQSDEFISYGVELPVFVARGSKEAETFIAMLGTDIQTVLDLETPHDYFLQPASLRD